MNRRRALPALLLSGLVLAAGASVVARTGPAEAASPCPLSASQLSLAVPGGGTVAVCDGTEGEGGITVSRYGSDGTLSWTAVDFESPGSYLHTAEAGVVDQAGRTWVGGQDCSNYVPGQGCGSTVGVTGFTSAGVGIEHLSVSQPSVDSLVQDGNGALGTFSGPSCTGCVDYTSTQHFPTDGPTPPTPTTAPTAPTAPSTTEATPPTAPTTTSEPTTTAPSGPEVTVDAQEVAPGDLVTVRGGGFAADTRLDIELHSTPVRLATTMSAGDGSFAVEVTIPIGTAPGDHEIVASGLDPTGRTRSVATPIVVAATPVEAPTTDPPAEAGTPTATGATPQRTSARFTG